MPGNGGRKVCPGLAAQTEREDASMGKASRQTMNKMNRERELKEKRALKQERKEQKKLAAAEAATAEPEGPLVAPTT